MIDVRYRDLLATLAIRQCLARGETPSPSQIKDELDQILAGFPDQTKPQASFLLAQFLLGERERPSAAKFNGFFQSVAQDLTVLHQECVEQSTSQLGLLSRNLKEIKMLQSRLRSLEHDLNSALLVNKDSLGYQHYLSDNFSDATLINLAQTTASLDLAAHVAAIGRGQAGLYRYPLEHLSPSDCQAVVLSRTGLISSGINVADLANIFHDGEETWRSQLKYSKPGQQVILDLNIRLSNQPLSLNRLRVANYAYSSNPTTLQVQYSLDNYVWQDLEAIPAQRVFGEVADLLFPTTQVKWLKLRLGKNWQDYQDGAFYVYEFGLKGLSLYHQDYNGEGAELVSLPLAVQDQNGQAVSFDQVSLEVCEALPTGTNINYYLSFDQGLNYSQLAPQGRQQGNVPQVLRLRNQTLTPSSIFGLDLITEHPYQNPEDILLSFSFPAQTDLNHLQLWRNIGTRGRTNPVRYGTTGWSLDGDYYTTTVLISGSGGFNLNLGSTSLILDGVTQTGNITLSPGTHLVRVLKSLWSPLYLQGASTKADYLTEVVELGTGNFTGRDRLGRQVQAFDPLYPYNQKLLIQGLNYQVQQGNQWIATYPGVSLYAQFLMEQVSEFDLTANVRAGDLSRYALGYRWGETGLQEPYLLTKYLTVNPGSQDNYNLEEFQLFSLQANPQVVSSAIFKAIFTQGDTQVSPQLYSYTIKLGQYPGAYDRIIS